MLNRNTFPSFFLLNCSNDHSFFMLNCNTFPSFFLLNCSDDHSFIMLNCNTNPTFSLPDRNRLRFPSMHTNMFKFQGLKATRKLPSLYLLSMPSLCTRMQAMEEWICIYWAQTDGSYSSVVWINDCLKEEELVMQGLMSLLAEVNRLSKRPHDQGHNLEGDPCWRTVQCCQTLRWHCEGARGSSWLNSRWVLTFSQLYMVTALCH